MVQRCEQTSFSLEPRDPLGVKGASRWQNLYGDVSRQPRVACAIDFPHRARVERSHDLVRPELDPWR